MRSVAEQPGLASRITLPSKGQHNPLILRRLIGSIFHTIREISKKYGRMRASFVTCHFGRPRAIVQDGAFVELGRNVLAYVVTIRR